MSATARPTGVHPARRAARRDGSPVVVFSLVVITIDIAIVLGGLVVHRWLANDWTDLLIWGLLIALAGSITVSAGETRLGFDLPVLLGAGFVFGPLAAGLLGLMAVFDLREFRHEVPLRLCLFNRAQISLSAMAGASVFRLMGVGLGQWPWTALAGLAAFGVDAFVNYGLVAAYWSTKSRRPLAKVVQGMRFGPVHTFAPTYACFGFMGVLIAEAYLRIGIGGVIAFVAPVLLARQAFVHRHLLDGALGRLHAKDLALGHAESQIAKERRDERMVLAGELHDEVLPPLFQVHLMGQVLKQDLMAGRLLDLDDDLPQLLVAIEVAQTSIRDLVRNLRRSSLGAGGLLPSIRVFAQQLETSGSPKIELHLDEFPEAYTSQLLVYQVVREALSNAARYSRATHISVCLTDDDGAAHLVIEDDGIGFDQAGVDCEEHFGLQLVHERVGAAGGVVTVDSRLGTGTTVTAVIPSPDP